MGHMKKEYIKPISEIVRFSMPKLLAGSVTEIIEITNEEADSNFEVL